MGDRTSGFLHPSERAYLEEEGFYGYPYRFEEVESGGKQAKSRIQREVVPSLQMLLIQFHTDLTGVHHHQRSDAETWRDWEKKQLPRVERELKRLRDDLTQLIETAERDDFAKEQEELEKSLSHLHKGEHHPSEVIPPGGVGNHPHEPPEPLQDLTTEELEERFTTLRTREDGLMTILQEEERPQILEYINENGPCSLEEKQISGNGEYWATVASRELTPVLIEKEEISNEYREYMITKHGESVLKCWEALVETVEKRIWVRGGSGGSKRELVRDALKLHELPYRHRQDRD